MRKQEIRNNLDELVSSISYRSQLISRAQKLDSGIITTRRIGFIAGFLTAVVFVLVIPLIIWHLIGAI
ncbi:tetrahydromethanopterin S-methyltransferase subunit F [Methanimicrococcus blatticola]|uniref:Tetrahydromethanopterin S-methyltransferase subunit F n=1 Tax=Methanimicrococcus blatticola TaxID=91560 RepID=A0A484F6Z2_9EURY|nr:tetrahydromethanopterin S-methyltransferase subunit F [Methanimicrococcus blatticola]MBZ3936116.1 tetrahydromethanopterin S-methyltransferase subunit F [Methanimicrococcus blatticola]MCC2508359.1 tetrahydromethanopterin S-methyltransferase subunit F [Methanimicrococcus blatticola]TDQ70188.1 tetrahydromethanopterin S-methyltransferase subunit F [Methanimicrococcus blatticola]